MKKILSIFMAIIAPSALWAGKVITYTATYKLKETTDYYSSGFHVNAFNVVITDHSFSNGNGTITFAGEVTSIGDRAFNSCTNLTSIIIPNSVTKIGEATFAYCTGLTSINIPDNVLNIGSSAFAYCTGLPSITIPKGVNQVGPYAFSRVKNIIYPGSLTGAPWGACCLNGTQDGYLIYRDATKRRLCSCLTAAIGTLNIPNTVDTISSYAFYNCASISSVTIPNSVTYIGSSTFYGCTNLQSVTLPQNLKRILSSTFYGCENLTNISIPNSVTTIGDYAFSMCTSLPVENSLRYADTYLVEAADKTLSTYSIKEGTKWIGDLAFKECTELSTINIPSGVIRLGGEAFVNCGSLKSITIPNSVKSIGKGAFYYCKSLTSITIPSNIISIGERAFALCDSLASIFVDKENKYFSSVDGVLFNHEKDSLIQYPMGSHRTSYTIPNGVARIGDWSFYKQPYYNCPLLSITIPSSVTYIGLRAFVQQNTLTSIICYATTPPTCGESCFYLADTSTPLYVPAGSVTAYQTADQWSDFTQIQAIAAEEVPTTTVITTPTDNSVTIIWPTKDGADSYTIVIYKGGVTFCTLTFNAQGQLTNIAFAPGRGANNETAMAEAVAGGYKFTITSLNPGTKYTYEIDTQNASGTSIANYTGTFTTTSPAGIINVNENVNANVNRKVMRDGQLLILRDGKIYNAQGAIVE